MKKIIYLTLAFINGVYLFGAEYTGPRERYQMEVVLDEAEKRLQGKSIITWKNLSDSPVGELRFHLYYNAFKNSRSTFMKSAATFGFLESLMEQECAWGFIKINSAVDEEGEELISSSMFISPDDGNPYDETVMLMPLRKTVESGDSVTITLQWEAKIPKAMVRTGYNQDFFFFAQWYPKLGVYETKGMRGRTENGWNCHQYHASGEYYGEFGEYEVMLDLPVDYEVGGSGELVQETVNGDRKRVQFKLKKGIDFTWTTSPRFIRSEAEWENVKITLLTYPEHLKLRDRYFMAIKQAIEYMDEYVGAYPYSTLTVVDVPIFGLFTGGMEYPTLISSISFRGVPLGIKVPETLVAHEFVHQYFMQMIASHEQEEPWMDEGFTTYYEGRILDHYYGVNKSMIDLWGIRMGNSEYNRIQFFASPNSKSGDNSFSAKDFKNGGYGVIAYNKTAMMLKTLEGILGRTSMDLIMKAYFERWKFRHPSGDDFIGLVKEMVPEEREGELKLDLDLFFKQVLYGSDRADYAVGAIRNQRMVAGKGFIDNEEVCILENGPLEDFTYKAEVIIERKGEVILPVDVRITFDDGSVVDEIWDGMDRFRIFSFPGNRKVIRAEVDPYRKLDLDENRINNVALVNPNNAFKKYGVRYKMVLQHFFDFLNFFS